jgi:hypothetical protein
MCSLPASSVTTRWLIGVCSLGLLLLSILPSMVLARTIHVAQDGNDLNDGSGWSKALANIPTAIRAATDDDVIFVKSGYYTPTTMIMKFDKRLQLYGGFSGNEPSSDPSERNWWINRTFVHGGGAPCFTINAPTTIDGVIMENSDFSIVAGIDSSATTTLRNCVIQRNDGVTAGAIWQSDDSLTLINCLVVENTMLFRSDIPYPTGFWPAIILANESPLTLIHCTIANNEVLEGEEDGEISPSSNLTIINSIIRGKIGTPTGPATVIHSNIEGGFPGVGNIDIDPRFGSEYKLLPDSPCIDTGTPSEVLSDIRNLPRPIDIPGIGFDGNMAFDMGAFEYRVEDIPTPTKTPTPDPHADINEDGMVGAEDLLILMREWGRHTEH